MEYTAKKLIRSDLKLPYSGELKEPPIIIRNIEFA